MVKFEEFLNRVSSHETSLQDIGGASIWGIADSICRDCQGTNFLCIEDTENPNFETIKCICITGLHVRPIQDLSLDEQKLIRQRATFALDELGKLGVNISPLLASSDLELSVTIAQTPENSESTSVPVPAGYKTVGWIKLSEAQAIAATFEGNANQSCYDKNGKEILETIWHPDGDPMVKKYHSNCEVIRKKSGKRMWVRLEEAQAVIEANQLESSVDFRHIDFGGGGLAEFFPSTHPAAKKFRSNVRLLRKYK